MILYRATLNKIWLSYTVLVAAESEKRARKILDLNTFKFKYYEDYDLEVIEEDTYAEEGLYEDTGLYQ